MLIIVILAVIVVVVGGYALITYNKFVSLRNESEQALSSIDVQLKRRHDLIPNLVETVKGYATHESTTLEEVTKARAAATAAPSAQQDPKAAAAAESLLGGALMKLLAVSEAYPDLKANQNFLELQQELTATEDKIAAARRYYNSTVQIFNTRLQQFPSSIVGRIGGFAAREFFELDDPSEREAPTVSFAG